MIRYIDMYRDRFGVERICRVLNEAEGGFITSRGYRAAKTRVRSARDLKDDMLIPEIQRIYSANYSVYGCGRCGTPWAEKAGTSAGTRPTD